MRDRCVPEQMGRQARRGGGKQFSQPDEIEGDEPRRTEGGGKSSRGLGAQSATAGMMPPSDSDSDDESEDGVSGHTNGQSKNAGMMPPSDSDDESDDEVAPLPKGKPPPGYEMTRREREQLKAQKEPVLDPEELAKNMEKLAMVKKRREDQRLKRIATDGWDRMKPVSEDNRPPGSPWPLVE